VLTTSMAFKAELARLLQQAIAEQVDVITAPHTMTDFGAYKHHIGIVAGLRSALELLEEAESIVNKRERGA